VGINHHFRKITLPQTINVKNSIYGAAAVKTAVFIPGI
jgi:hypothetical protein